MKENPLSRWVDKPRPIFKRLMVGYLALVTGCTNTVENLEHASAQENSRSSAYHYNGDPGKALDQDKSQLPELYGASRPEKHPPAAKGSLFEGAAIPAEQQLIADPFNSRSKGGDELQSMVAGALSSAASTEVKEWFSARHTTAELSLTAGKSGVRSGSFDLLLPIFDTDADLVFTQLGIRRSNVRTEGYRNTINLGAGWRHTLDKWLFGANAFYDRDTTGRNDRIGIGAEAWTDYLKLSANGYFRLSDWKVSPDLDDYLERPANGWDVRAEAYLPAYPQLGGKLAYEQYYGDEVGLFSATDRQKNPSAVTVGLNYAPVPALVFGADYRQGQGGISETTVKMGINYQFGVPLAKQWSPDQVKASRLLTNARYDLVSRNNEIVLDYKKAPAKGTVSLPSTLSAYGNTALTFVVSIAGDVSNIGWLGSGAQFALPYNGSALGTIVLPSYTPAGPNTYQLQAVGTVRGGEPVTSNVMTVTVLPLALLLERSKAVAKADGTDEVTFTATVSGTNAEPVAERNITWKVSGDASLVESSQRTDAKGKAFARLTSRNVGRIDVQAVESDGLAADSDATFTAGTAASIALTAQPPNLPADGTATTTLTATVNDASGHPVSKGVVVDWSTTAGTLASSSSSTDDKGIATIVLTSSTVAGLANVVAKANQATATASVAFAIGTAAGVSLTASPSSITADGTSTSTLTATVKDAHGNAVPAVSVTWKTSAGTLASGSSSTNASGVATVVLTSSTTAGSATVDATAGTGNASALVSFEPDTNTAKVVSVVATPGTVQANVENGIQLVATVQDAHGNLVPANVRVTWSSTGGDLSQTTTYTDASGRTTNAFGGSFAGSYTITASAVGGSAGTVVSVTANVGQASVVGLVASPSSILADGVSTSTLTATVEDENGNRLGAGIPVSWTNSAGVLNTGVTYTDASGRATNTLTSSVGLFTATIGARVGSKPQRTTTVAFIADSSRPKVQSLVASPTTIVANGISSSTLTATVTDDKGNPLGAGFAVTWGTTSGTTLSNVANVTDSTGKATATLTGTLASVATVTAGASAGSATANVLLTADIGTPSVASIIATPASIPANDSTTSTIEVVLTDAHSNKLGAGIPVTWTTTWGTLLQSSTVTDATGKTSVQLKGPYSGPATVKASTSYHSMTTVVQLTPDPNTTAVRTLTPNPVSVIANGVAYTTLTGHVTDGNGNLSVGQKVRWSTNEIGQFSEPESIVDATGTVTVRMTSTKAGVAYPQANTNYGYISSNVFFNADPATASVDSIAASSTTVPADGTPVTITVRAIDANGSPVAYTNVSWTSTLNNLSRSTSSTGSDGVATITLSGTNLGAAQVKATITSSGATGTVTVNFQ